MFSKVPSLFESIWNWYERGSPLELSTPTVIIVLLEPCAIILLVFVSVPPYTKSASEESSPFSVNGFACIVKVSCVSLVKLLPSLTETLVLYVPGERVCVE
jgi:hypothetical protein